MKITELKKLFEKADVTDRKVEAKEIDDTIASDYRVEVRFSKDDVRRYSVNAKTPAEARAAALDMVINESDHLRGFELEGDK